MNCRQFNRSVNDLALGLLPPEAAARMENHARHCPHCRHQIDTLADWSGRMTAHAERRADVVRDPIWSAVQASLCDAPLPSRPRGAVSPARLLAWAAVLAALLAGGWLTLITPTRSPDLVPTRVAWVLEGSERIRPQAPASVLVMNERVYTLRHEAGVAHVVALDKRTGRFLWETAVRSVGPMAADADHLYLAESGREHRLVALEVATGAVAWEHRHTSTRPGSRSPSTLFVLDNKVYWSRGDDLRCVDQSSGQLVWTRAAGEQAIRAMVAGHTDLLFAALDTEIWAVRTSDGTIAWRRPHEGAGRQPTAPFRLAAHADTVFLAYGTASGRGRLISFDTTDGGVRWQRDTDPPLNLSVLRNRLYLRTHGLQVFAADTGRPLWAANIPGCSPVSGSDEKVYLLGGIDQRTVFAFDALHGAPVWSFPLSGSCTNLAVDDGMGYLSGHDGLLYALKLDENG